MAIASESKSGLVATLVLVTMMNPACHATIDESNKDCKGGRGYCENKVERDLLAAVDAPDTAKT